MSARTLNPAMMTEVSRNLGGLVATSSLPGPNAASASGIRAAPSHAALARVRRDLFGPVDHMAARALAEHELHAQSILDAERWGFDFRLEMPRAKEGSRFQWELITPQDVVPEPYALRGMTYLKKQSSSTPLQSGSQRQSLPCRSDIVEEPLLGMSSIILSSSKLEHQAQFSLERTPWQETRVPILGETTSDIDTELTRLSFREKTRNKAQSRTSVISKKQAAITDFMKSRKRILKGTAKSVLEQPKKVARNMSHIRS